MSVSVQVTNISASATEKAISDFFGFCGTITSISLTREEDGLGSAVVTFESQSAAKTAQLLSNSIIIDSPISVSSCAAPAKGNTEAPTASKITTGEDAPAEGTSAAPDAHGEGFVAYSTEALQQISDAGYRLGDTASQRLKSVDERFHVSEKLKGGAAIVSDTVTQGALKGKETAEVLREKASALDDDYKISETVVGTAKASYEAVAGVTNKGIESISNSAVTKEAVTVLSETSNRLWDYTRSTASAWGLAGDAPAAAAAASPGAVAAAAAAADTTAAPPTTAAATAPSESS